MRTSDFSKAPQEAQGEAMFFGGTRYAGVRAMVRLFFVWRRVRRGMVSSPGYKGHFVWYQFPFTLGNVSLWERGDDMMAFARSPEHRDAIAWLLRPGVADGAFIRFLQAQPEGHTLGIWRAELDPSETWRNPQRPFSGDARRGPNDPSRDELVDEHELLDGTYSRER